MIVLALFLIWSIYVVRKGHLTLHTLFGVYAVTLFLVDYGDVSFDFWLNLYDLPVHLLNNLDIGGYLGIILSDGIIFPLVAIVFCYYSVRYHRPWLLSILFALMLGTIEFIFVKTGYMVYHYWNHWITPAIVFISLRIFAHFSDRFIHYSPPISYRLRLLCSIYAFVEWPGAVLGGAMRLFQFKLNIFNNEIFDDRIVAMIFTTIMGGLAAVLITKIPQKYKIMFFLGLAITSSIFNLLMHSQGLFLYNYWNSLLVILRYIIPYLVVYFYDRWEGAYTRRFDPKNA